MLDQNGIRLAIRRQLQTAQGERVALPDMTTRFAYENVDFTPPDPGAESIDDAVWVRETFIWGREPQMSYGYLELMGIAQYDVMVPAGRGTEYAENLAKLIGDTLRHASGMIVTGTQTPSGEDVQVSIVRAEPGRGYKWNDGPWYGVPVHVNFRAYGLVPSSV